MTTFCRTLILLPGLAVALALLILAPGAQAAGDLPGFRIEVGTNAAPVVASARTVGPETGITFKVNGKRVDTNDVYGDGPSRRYVELSASDGLEPGENVIEAKRATGDGTLKASLLFELGRGDLLADAGEDTAVIASGPPVSLGGGTSGAGDAEYRWKVIDSPRNADFKLQGAQRPRPTMGSATPGVYRLQLDVRKKGGSGVSHDRLAVTVDKDTPPIGAPINTIGANGAITIGNDTFGAGGEVAWVVLDRSSGESVESGTVTRTADGVAKLKERAEYYKADRRYQRYIMVISGRTGIPEAQLSEFGKVLRILGTNVPTPDNFAALRSGLPFSVFGIPGGARGAGTTRFAPTGASPAVPGNIVGYLQKNQAVLQDGSQIYDLVTPEHITYDTKSASSATSNTMTIGGRTITATLPAGATAGLHIVALSSLTGNKFWEETMATNFSDATKNAASQTAGAQRLKDILDTPGALPIIFVQSIGKPKAAGPAWDGIVKQLRRVGANANYLYGLDGTTTYALVGSVDAMTPPNESSDAYDKGPYGDPGYPTARLRGIVSRGRDSRLVPTVSGTPTPKSPTGAINTDLVDILWQPATSFPVLAKDFPAAERTAVAQWFCTEKLGFCKGQDSCTEIRACYWQRYTADWPGKLSLVTGATYPGSSAGFSSGAFDQAKQQLSDEISALTNVQNYVRHLQQPVPEGAVAGVRRPEADRRQDLQRPAAARRLQQDELRPRPDRQGAEDGRRPRPADLRGGFGRRRDVRRRRLPDQGPRGDAGAGRRGEGARGRAREGDLRPHRHRRPAARRHGPDAGQRLRQAAGGERQDQQQRELAAPAERHRRGPAADGRPRPSGSTPRSCRPPTRT